MLFCLYILGLNLLLTAYQVRSTLLEVNPSETQTEKTCKDPSEASPNTDYYLDRIDPIEVGHIRNIKLTNDRTHRMITRSVLPPIFTIDHFLTDEECEYIKNKAKESDLIDSYLHLDKNSLADLEYRISNAKYYGANMEYWDINEDGCFTPEIEIRMTAEKKQFLYLEKHEIESIIEKYSVPLNNGECISAEQFEKINIGGMAAHLAYIKQNAGKHKDRFSKQTWLRLDKSDKIINELLRKLTVITNLSDKIISNSEMLQVVNYGIDGHYFAHYDSQSTQTRELPCCQNSLKPDGLSCRLCRYITVLYFLNDVEEGGETAFPVADKVNFNKTDFELRKDGDRYNLNNYCHKSNLVVSPKKGTAVMWYNHHTTEDGYLDDVDPYSLHGGCQVIRGEKWIANNWISGIERPENLKQDTMK